MKKLLYALLALVVLLVAAVLLGPGLIDWNAYRSEIAARVERATGRDVAIQGDVSLSILPSPAFSASGVRLANVAGGSDPAMASVRALRVKVRLAPLLQGRVEVEQITLLEPDILVEVLPDGTANWQFADSAKGGDSADGADGGGGGGFIAQVSLDSFRIADGTVRYRDAAAGIEETVSGIDAEIAANSLQGPFDAKGRMTVRGVPLRFKANIGRVKREGTTPYKLSLGVVDSTAEAELTGAAIVDADGGSALRGKAELRGDDLRGLLKRLRLGDNTAPQLAQRFEVSGQLKADREKLDIEELDVRLGEVSADGAVSFAFGKPLDLRSKLRVQQVNLDRLLAMDGAAKSGAPSTDGDGRAATEGESPAFALPADLRAELDLRVDALIYRGQVVRQGRLNAVLADGSVTLNQAMALLPGGSDLALFGTLDEGPRGAVFDGRVEAASDNLRAIFDWFDIDVEGIPAGRLRRMNLLADVKGTGRQLTITSLDLDVDAMKVSGGIAVALRRRPGIGVGLSVDKLNLDAYLPRDRADNGGAGEGGGGQAGGPLGAAIAATLGGLDANLDLRAGTVTYAGESLRDVRFDATLQQGDLTVRKAHIGRVASSSLTLAGMVTGLSDLNPRIDATVDVATEDPRRLAGLFNAREPVPEGLGPMALTGVVGGGFEKLSVDLELEGLGGAATAKGDIRPLPGPLGFNLDVALKHANLRGLVGRIPDAPKLRQGLGGLDLEGKLSGNVTQPRAQEFSGRIGPVELSGALDADLTGPRPMIRANLETGELPLQALGVLGGSTAPAPDGRGGDGAAGRSAGSGRWSDTPLELGRLRDYDGELTLRSKAVILDDGMRLEGAVFDAVLDKGVLDVETLTGTLLGGTVAVIGTADTNDGLTAGFDINANKIDSSLLLSRGFDFERISGPMTLSARLNAEGRSERAVVKSLNGEGKLSGKLTVEARAEDRATNMLLNMLGEKVKELGGVAETTTSILDAFADRPAQLSGTFDIEDGIVHTRDTTLTGQGASAVLQGQADLPNWRMDARIDLIRESDAPDAPYMTTLLRGPLDRPNPTIKGGPFRVREPGEPAEAEAQQEPAAEPQVESSETPAQAPSEEKPKASDRQLEQAQEDTPGEATARPEEKPAVKKPSAEDIIRGLLKSLPKKAE
ncbi:AsmA family protein [Ferruginivarius sediminum]|uniref:AsmA family protein n=1 Tax=Ferruginivarius sediminum TaxID=2661937 RepID=A0A369TEF6_9PROT|nr:AsmA family protein [Ferruginivarius sediminum]RDD62527.1 AsmA family protein [Ferruginivarius sediminum]